MKIASITNNGKRFQLAEQSKPVKLLLLIILSLAILVLKSYFFLPLPQRFISATGLYHHLNEMQFKETFVFTFLIILYVSFKHLNIRLRWALGFSFAAAFANLGLMLIDARYQTYTQDIERFIAANYGTPLQLYTMAGCFLIITLAVGICGALANIDNENPMHHKWRYKVGFLALILLGLFVEFTVQWPFL